MRGILSAERGGWLRSIRWESLRTRLIFWNVVTLSLLLAVLGITARAIVVSSMMAAVDRELDVRTSLRGHGPPRDGRGPGGPPQEQQSPFDDGQRPAYLSGGQRSGRPPSDSGGERQSGPPASRDRGQRPNDGRQSDPGGPPPPHDEPKNPFRPVHFDLKGSALDSSNYTRPIDPQGFNEALQGSIHRGTVEVDGEQLRVLSRPFPEEGPVEGVVQAPYPLTELYIAVDGLNRALLLLVPIGLFGAGMAGAFLTNQVLRRVRHLSQAAGRIGVQALSERLPAAGNDEFSELAQTFNSLLGRLQTAFQRQERLIEQQRRFTADASHELKTPLTIVKGNAGLLIGNAASDSSSLPVLKEIDHAADTMSRLVQDLLLLARSDDGQLGRNPIEFLASEVLQRAAARIGSRPGPAIKFDIADPTLTIHGNEQELIRLFANLLDNAVKYTPAEGHITVTATREKSGTRITITDTGTGIAAEHIPHLGERFYRADASRTRSEGGTGLGLSICRSIVEAHHGTLSIQSDVGTGTKVTVTLPDAS